MSKLRVRSFSISIDGYGAGPNQDLENPLFCDAAIFVALITRDLGLVDAKAFREIFLRQAAGDAQGDQ